MRYLKTIKDSKGLHFSSLEYIYVFGYDKFLRKYHLNGNIIWEEKLDNSQSLILHNGKMIIAFMMYRYIYIVNEITGYIVLEREIPFFPICINKYHVLGEELVDKKRFISKYEINTDRLNTMIRLPDKHYCISIYKDYVLVGEEINYTKFIIYSLVTGQVVWNYEMTDVTPSLHALFYSHVMIVCLGRKYIAFNLETGTQIWQKPINIDVFDEEKGLIYVLENDFIVLDATSGEELIRVEDWSKRQLEKYPALFFISSPCSLSEEYLVFSSRATLDEFGEGGVFFIDKETAEVKEYFRIVFDKDPVQRTGWYGNKIPDDQQIPFMPIDKPIYKDGRLYVLLPSPIEGQRDLYIYEKE